MATFFRNKLIKDAGTVPINALESNSSQQFTIIGFALTNTSDYPVNVNVTLVDDTSVETYYVKDTPVPTDNSLRIVTQGEKLIVPPDYTLKVWSDENDAIDVTISYVEIV